MKKPKPEKEPEPLYPIEVYLSSEQIGYNQFNNEVVVTDTWDFASTNYKKDDRTCAKRFCALISHVLAQEEGQAELHCKGDLIEYSHDEALDGYFGRPKIIIKRTNFLRRLRAKERAFFQKHFDRFNKESKLQLMLVD